jgi:hypothetical protein
MQLRQIQKGKWYETKLGSGISVSVGGKFPPSVQVRIVAPSPRGVVTMTPRDVPKEVDPPSQPPQPQA